MPLRQSMLPVHLPNNYTFESIYLSLQGCKLTATRRCLDSCVHASSVTPMAATTQVSRGSILCFLAILDTFAFRDFACFIVFTEMPKAEVYFDCTNSHDWLRNVVNRICSRTSAGQIECYQPLYHVTLLEYVH